MLGCLLLSVALQEGSVTSSAADHRCAFEASGSPPRPPRVLLLGRAASSLTG